ncbi:hypothetical protein GG344DRAFT_73676 [Lentinula edodes]|nr:hypothetical protein GG344DRAFT_73676 [Lentinula edodes]
MSSSKLSFESASHFTIQGSEINNVGRDHIVITNNNYHQHHDEYLINLIAGKRFRSVPFGDVFLLGTMARVTYGPQGSVKVVRSFHPARVTGIGDNSHFTVVTYQGPHANEAFRSDVLQYSRLRHPNLAQLFGIIQCDPSVEGMLLHSALVPLQHFAGLCASDPFAFTYLKYRYLVDSVAVARTTESLHRYIPPEQYWMQPTSGLICMGPLGPSYESPRRYENIYALWPHDSDYFQPTTIPQLDFQNYTSYENVISHIEQHFDTFESFVGSHLGSKSVEVLFAEGDPLWLSFGSVISVSENDDCLTLKSPKLLAQACLDTTAYSIGRWTSLYHDDALMSINQENGWTRVVYSPCQDFYPSYFYIDLEAHIKNSDLEAAWLAQSGHILQHNKSDRYGSKMRMILQISGSSPIPTPCPSQCAYLFIAPLKIGGSRHFSFDETPYFWSLDSSGSQRMSQKSHEQLGLPAFEIGFYEGRHCSEIEHCAISRYLMYKGFDPLELDYARAQGYLAFEVMGDPVKDQSSAVIEALSDAPIEIVSALEDSEPDPEDWELVSISEGFNHDEDDDWDLMERPKISGFRLLSHMKLTWVSKTVYASRARFDEKKRKTFRRLARAYMQP